MTNRSKQVRRVKRRNNNKDKFIYTNNLNLIKPYAKYHVCIENFISRFEINDIILSNKNYGFALIQYKNFCPIIIQDDHHCLDFFLYQRRSKRKRTWKEINEAYFRQFPNSDTYFR